MGESIPFGVKGFVEFYFLIFGNLPTTCTIWKHSPPTLDSWFENPSPKGCAMVAGGPVFNWYISLLVLALGEQLLLSDLWSNRLWTMKSDPEQDHEKSRFPIREVT